MSKLTRAERIEAFDKGFEEGLRRGRRMPRVETFDHPTFWVLWNPLSFKPPRVKFTTRAEAEQVAAKCAVKYRAPVYVMEARAVFEEAAPPVKKSTLG
jgi:hypothetical protein